MSNERATQTAPADPITLMHANPHPIETAPMVPVPEKTVRRQRGGDAMTETAALRAAAQAICRIPGPGDPTCVMDDHPEREPCDETNCMSYRRAIAALAAYQEHSR